jgi:hypothetical protein
VLVRRQRLAHAGRLRAVVDERVVIREVIGRGGMGEVVAAYDPNIGRDVALKRMRGEPTAEVIRA